jgi:hypothetical protein
MTTPPDQGQHGDQSSPWPHSRQDAEVEDIVSALRRYGVLTRARLAELCGSAHWPDSGFGSTLRQAVSTGRVRRLGDELYEVAEPGPGLAATGTKPRVR